MNIVEKTFCHIHIDEEDSAQGSVPLCFEKKQKEKPKSNLLNTSKGLMETSVLFVYNIKSIIDEFSGVIV